MILLELPLSDSGTSLVYAAVAKAQSLIRLKHERRIATLLAFAIAYTIHAQDDAVEVLTQLVHKYLAEASSNTKQNRLTSLSSFDDAALELAKMAGIVLDESVPNDEVRQRIFALSARAANRTLRCEMRLVR